MDLTDIKGIGKKKKECLQRLSINSVSDLYNYYPKEYEDRSKKFMLSSNIDENKHYFEWTIESKIYMKYSRKSTISYLYASENEKKIKLIWFNDKFSPRKLKIGETYKFYTKVKTDGQNFECYNPMFTNLKDLSIGSIIPIYSLTRSITNNNLRNFINEALKYYNMDENFLGDKLIRKFEFSSKLSNLKEIHSPSSIIKLKKAKSEIKIVDFLKELIFIYLMNKENYYQKLDLEYNLDEILRKLDFKLTSSQYKSLVDILNDINSNSPMNRLLCGDVGSGKTIIAIISMIIFGLNKYQSAMMVPTEVLASQQYEKNKDFIESFGLKVSLLTSSTKNKDKIKMDLKKGKIDILIGTHALIVDDVDFNNLKFIVADEQHRFGVRQRQSLYQKGSNANYLTMTATPIPRTLYLKISKLLNLSQITELPKGRGEIRTEIILESMRNSIDNKLKKVLAEGRQVYIVSDSIDSDDKNSVENLYSYYKSNFREYKVKKLHGKLKSIEKEDILKEFSKGNIDILISTTIIEVGIDVKNANTMLIYNANNFGLSSLHQLRGRIGRGRYESYCYLICEKFNEKSKLNIIKNSNDGFEIARKDLKLRGAGKILSTIQHGKNLNDIDYFNLKENEINLCFEIFEFSKEENFKNINLKYLENYFNIDKGIVLN
ncbi:ATP-dependent DNA helicase RecG [Anaerococcus sp. AGMB00486]|uniref:ATP-dependent DNA helicase RecG n=1 Tax=Anaerococcus faecalis TaxID=2742993 RepID=A0ABX2N726_9FIRM|nr:ATP-dependent DNA helicase RecG [Anaerococcus faecalis]NVF10489.1 ATP-dependent DNA helicase RecG [Anaerococcus faecalis]